MDAPYFYSQTLPLWVAAVLAFVLLIMSGRIADIGGDRRLDAGAMLFKGLILALIALLALFPALLVETAGASVNAGLLFYILFFSLFFYYVGKRAGWKSGRRHLGEMLGIESPEHMEDTQDRLFESRLRFPSRADVVKSIGVLAKAQPVSQDQVPAEGIDLKSDPVPPVSQPAVDPELAQIEAYFRTGKDKSDTRQ